jgi:hypothetical protein
LAISRGAGAGEPRRCVIIIFVLIPQSHFLLLAKRLPILQLYPSFLTTLACLPRNIRINIMITTLIWKCVGSSSSALLWNRPCCSSYYFGLLLLFLVDLHDPGASLHGMIMIVLFTHKKANVFSPSSPLSFPF